MIQKKHKYLVLWFALQLALLSEMLFLYKNHVTNISPKSDHRQQSTPEKNKNFKDWSVEET